MSTCLCVCLSIVFASLLLADDPKDNISVNVRPIPPAGIPVPNEMRQELEAGLKSLGTLQH